MPSRLAIATLAAIALATSPAVAAGALPHWPGSVVRYADHSRSRWDVRTAVALWNRSQTGVRIVPARGGQRAQIRISSRGCPRALGGHAAGGPCAFYPP